MKKPKEIKTTLQDLYAQTSFCQDDEVPFWSSLKVEELDEDDIKERGDGSTLRIYVPECSTFGSTNIQLSGDYEQDGEDCLFIQELVRAYLGGRLKEVGPEDISVRSRGR